MNVRRLKLESRLKPSTMAPIAAPSPAQFVASMGMGINLGNVLDAPKEGQWAAPAEERYFDSYAAAGFRSVRVPCRWSQHTSTTPPYITAHNPFLARVFEVAGWSISRKLRTVINAHHDDWLDGAADDAAFTRALDRLVAIWRAVGERFAHVPDNLLAFEVYNEPHLNMTTRWLNRMNAAVLAVLPSRVSRIPVGPLRHFAARTSRPSARPTRRVPSFWVGCGG